jgi:hypothetical protein
MGRLPARDHPRSEQRTDRGTGEGTSPVLTLGGFIGTRGGDNADPRELLRRL